MQDALNEILTRKVRLWIYVVSFLALTSLTAWQGSEGNLLVFSVTTLGALQSVLSISKLNPEPPLQAASDAELQEEALSRDKVLVDGAHYSWLQDHAPDQEGE